VPSAAGTVVAAINDRGETTGSYGTPTGSHGFAYYLHHHRRARCWYHLADHGELTGSYTPPGPFMFHGFVYDNDTFTTFDPPRSVPQPVVINDQGEVAGWYLTTGSLVPHGFVYDNGTLTTIDVPGATSTMVNAIDDGGEVAGTYFDPGSGTHGFIAHDLPSRSATRRSMGDFLPGASGMDGGSSQSANAAGVSDQDPSTTVPIGAMQFARSPEAALSLMTDGHG
jgi:hypothetical protein